MEKKILFLITALTASTSVFGLSHHRFAGPRVKHATQALVALLSPQELQESLAETNEARREYEETPRAQAELHELREQLKQQRQAERDRVAELDPVEMYLKPGNEFPLPELFGDDERWREVQEMRAQLAPAPVIVLAKPAQQPLRTRPPKRKRSEKRPYACDTCGQAFKGQGNLTNHQRSHVPALCPTCGKDYKTPFALKKHAIIHTSEQPFACRHDGCDSAFNDVSSRRRHEAGHLNPNKGNFYCSRCNTTYTYKKNFINHGCDVGL